MASLNLSANGPSISKSYQAVVNGQPPAGSAASPTYAQWAVFSVSTPLVNTFQQDAGNKESVLKVQTTGDGELADLIEEFSEGRTQFAYVKVTDPNTGLPKNVLIAWCGEGVPERTKGYFTSHLAAVSKFLHGYHVQITARADGDLSPEGIVQRVADSSGSKYSGAEPSAPVPGPRPPVVSKPVFTPTRTGGLAPPPVSAAPQPYTARRGVDDDGWGPDAPPVTRTQLEKVQSAYKPTKVNLQELKAETTSAAYRQPPPAAAEEHGDVVRGGYQPVGKVDIAAIRKQAVQSGDMADDRPAPVKGAYEPVGKVDIAAIRARAQKPEDAGVASGSPSTGMRDQSPTTTTLPERPAVSDPAERLTSLPKPKVANKFGGGPAFAGTKPPLPSATGPKPSNVQIGSASRTFADEGGKTPAQLWAERKARERGEAPSPTVAEPASIPSQTSGSGAGWKSSYTGKTWAPVQIASATPVGQADVAANEPSEAEASTPSVRDIQNQFTHGEEEQPEPSRAIPIPGLPTGPTEPEVGHVAQQPVPSPPPQPRSPTPPTPPVREGSPIRVAMPVGRGDVADAHEEQHSPPPAMPIESLQEAVPDERDLEESSHDLGRAAAETTAADMQPQGGIQAKVQYDYEKSEDNEIDLREGEYVTDIEMVDKDWWLGVNERGERGLFPGNYVEVEDHVDPAGHETAPEPEPEPEVAAAAVPAVSSQGTTATALYDYEAAEDNEISFPEGAKIENVEFPDDDWWLGVYHGAQGLFPANYVQLDQ